MKQSECLPLYIIHGWGFDCSVFQILTEELQDSFDIRPINLPGYADQPTVSDYTLARLSSIVINQITEKGIILGWSLGGLLAISLAENYPEKVQSLILLASTPCFATKPDWFCAMQTSTLKKFICSYNSQPLATMEKFTYLVVEGSQQPREWIRYLKKKSSSGINPEALEAGLKILLETDLRRSLSQLQLSTTMIFAEKDSLIPADVKEEVLRLNSQINTVMIENTGHTPFLSHTRQLADSIRQHAEIG